MFMQKLRTSVLTKKKPEKELLLFWPTSAGKKFHGDKIEYINK